MRKKWITSCSAEAVSSHLFPSTKNVTLFICMKKRLRGAPHIPSVNYQRIKQENSCIRGGTIIVSVLGEIQEGKTYLSFVGFISFRRAPLTRNKMERIIGCLIPGKLSRSGRWAWDHGTAQPFPILLFPAFFNEDDEPGQARQRRESSSSSLTLKLPHKATESNIISAGLGSIPRNAHSAFVKKAHEGTLPAQPISEFTATARHSFSAAKVPYPPNHNERIWSILPTPSAAKPTRKKWNRLEQSPALQNF